MAEDSQQGGRTGCGGALNPEQAGESPEAIELRAFMGLAEVFSERGWSMPMCIPVRPGTTGPELLRQLDIALEAVEVVFVNGKATSPSRAVVSGGDRVALAPPGVPGPYRVLLGFRKM